jgi:hypothetical protein
MNLEQLLARRPEGVFINPFERNLPRFLRLLPSRIDVHQPGRLGDIERPRNNLVGLFLDQTTQGRAGNRTGMVKSFVLRRPTLCNCCQLFFPVVGMLNHCWQII